MKIMVKICIMNMEIITLKAMAMLINHMRIKNFTTKDRQNIINIIQYRPLMIDFLKLNRITRDLTMEDI